MVNMNKTVLVSFKERNKVLRINSSTNEREIACLKEQFCRAFGETISEGQFITFQRFDSTWDSFVDLEECDTVEDRDKLKVIVTESTSISNSGTVHAEASGSCLTQMEHSVSAYGYFATDAVNPLVGGAYPLKRPNEIGA